MRNGNRAGVLRLHVPIPARTEPRRKARLAGAGIDDNQADELLTLQHPPVVGAGGEVTQEQTAGLGGKRTFIRETLRQDASRIAEDASVRRADLLLLPSFNAVATDGCRGRGNP